MNEEKVIALMNSATSQEDWNEKCDQVKEDCGGYPEFWFSAIQLSGLAFRVSRRFNKEGIKMSIKENKGIN